MRVLVSIAKAKEYLYGMRLRPFSLGTQPKGHSRFIAPADIPESITRKLPESRYRFGIVVYPKPLSDSDIQHYSLTDLNGDDQAQWQKFFIFAQEMRSYGVDWDTFVADYIHPKGELRENNPLKDLKNAEFFKMVGDHGYSPNLKGLEKFYKSIETY
jgi:hypothetical protein